IGPAPPTSPLGSLMQNDDPSTRVTDLSTLVGSWPDDQTLMMALPSHGGTRTAGFTSCPVPHRPRNHTCPRRCQPAASQAGPRVRRLARAVVAPRAEPRRGRDSASAAERRGAVGAARRGAGRGRGAGGGRRERLPPDFWPEDFWPEGFWPDGFWPRWDAEAPEPPRPRPRRFRPPPPPPERVRDGDEGVVSSEPESTRSPGASSASTGWAEPVIRVVVALMPAARVRSRTSRTCSRVIKVTTVPALPARAVRPERWR